jgi:hypothetical protein
MTELIVAGRYFSPIAAVITDLIGDPYPLA